MRLRTFARAIAFQALYEDDLNPHEAPAGATGEDDDRRWGEVLAMVGRLSAHGAPSEADEESDAGRYRQWLHDPTLVDFTRGLLAGVRRHRTEIDEQIGRAAANWSIERMATADRNLLRLAAYELLFTDTPPKVAIDEAVELAKRFGGAQSASFVNGILDNLMHQNAERVTKEDGERETGNAE
jgi:transcription antitermination protein NusB